MKNIQLASKGLHRGIKGSKFWKYCCFTKYCEFEEIRSKKCKKVGSCPIELQIKGTDSVINAELDCCLWLVCKCISHHKKAAQHMSSMQLQRNPTDLSALVVKTAQAEGDALLLDLLLAVSCSPSSAGTSPSPQPFTTCHHNMFIKDTISGDNSIICRLCLNKKDVT